MMFQKVFAFKDDVSRSHGKNGLRETT